MFFGEITNCDAAGVREHVMSKNVKTVLNILSKHVVEVLVDPVEERLQDRGYARSLRSVHLFSLRSKIIAGGYTSCLKDYVKKRSFIRDRPKLQNPFPLEFSCDKFGRAR